MKRNSLSSDVWNVNFVSIFLNRIFENSFKELCFWGNLTQKQKDDDWKLCRLLFPEKVLLVLQALKHSALLEDIRMFLFWEGNTAKNLDKNHQAEEESRKDVGSAGG